MSSSIARAASSRHLSAHPPLVRSIFVFCLRAVLAAFPPPIWLSCSSLTCSSSACVFSSLASFWPRSASRPVRRILPDNFCLIFIGQTPVQRTGGARPLGCKVRDFSEPMLTGRTTAELCMGGTRGNRRQPYNQRSASKQVPKGGKLSLKEGFCR